MVAAEASRSRIAIFTLVERSAVCIKVRSAGSIFLVTPVTGDGAVDVFIASLAGGAGDDCGAGGGGGGGGGMA
jgi:hypothetical protein